MKSTSIRAHFPCPHPKWARVGNRGHEAQTRQNVTANRVSVPTLLTVPTVDNSGVGTKCGHGPAFTINDLQLGALVPTLFSLKTPGCRKKGIFVLKVACTARGARGAHARRTNRAKIGAL